MSVRTPVFFIWALAAFAILAASEVPARRLARQLPAAPAEAASIRSRHNESLKRMLAALGLPAGDDRSNVVARAAAFDLVTDSLTNKTGASAGRALRTDFDAVVKRRGR